jgi:hypothetical protein
MPQEPPDPAAAVAGLAREVEALRRALDQLRGLPGRVEELADLVTSFAEATAERPAPEAVRVTWSWLNLPEALQPVMEADGLVEDTERLLSDLVSWMGRVYLRYADAARTLPACWLWHPEVVEELVWLRAAWLAAYHNPDAVISQAADWHDRLRPGVVRRVKDYAGLCSVENHQPARDGDAPSHAGLAGVPLVGAAGLIAAWWATRRDRPAPAPTAMHVAEAAAQRPRAGLRGRA